MKEGGQRQHGRMISAEKALLGETGEVAGPEAQPSVAAGSSRATEEDRPDQ